MLVSFAGVLPIGLVNLVVSFALALRVALRSRGITREQTEGLWPRVIARFVERPRDVLLPPLGEARAEGCELATSGPAPSAYRSIRVRRRARVIHFEYVGAPLFLGADDANAGGGGTIRSRAAGDAVRESAQLLNR